LELDAGVHLHWFSPVLVSIVRLCPNIIVGARIEPSIVVLIVMIVWKAISIMIAVSILIAIIRLIAMDILITIILMDILIGVLIVYILSMIILIIVGSIQTQMIALIVVVRFIV